MQLTAHELTHHFNNQMVFEEVSFQLNNGDSLLLTGSNGSGKSTLLRILAGQLQPSKGEVKLYKGKMAIPPALFYRHLSWMSPGIELYTDLSLFQALKLHFSFKKLSLSGFEEFLSLVQLDSHRNKSLKQLSSGMLNRFRFGLAIFSESDYLLLDETTANMDDTNTALIHDLIRRYKKDRILIYASNKKEEYSLFKKRLNLG